MQNSALALWLAFSLLSVTWSDFPLAAFKKFFRDTGIYMAILVVLSDPRPVEAVRTVLRRVCYLLVPLSILLIKYYPQLGKTWSPWGGQEHIGVTTSKNMLGVLCLVSGIFFFWDTAVRWHERTKPRIRRVIRLNFAFMGMILWLLHLSDSKTSTICVAIGCLVIAGAHCKFGRRHPGWIKTLAPASFLVYVVLAVGFDMAGDISQAVGRPADMSDRTRIWEVVLSVPINPILGTGYQSFWLGPRVAWVWEMLTGNYVLQAHNGYLQTYLDLGLIGLFLLCAFLIATYRKICKGLDLLTPFSSLALGLWTLLLFYNVTETAFGAGLLFVTFLMASLPAAQPVEDQVEGSAVRPGTEQPASLLSTRRGHSGALVRLHTRRGSIR
jgi:O-antigen ligase